MNTSLNTADAKPKAAIASKLAPTTAYRSLRTGAVLLSSLLVLAGCSVMQTYERPAVDTPQAFKEAPAGNKDWKPAQPSEELARGEWWTVFGDGRLNTLVAQAMDANQDLKAAAARLAQSRALVRDARSQQSPQVGAGFGPTRQRQSPAAQGLDDSADGRALTLWRAQATVAYEVDLFGRVAAGVDAASATAQQREALFRSLQLALQADVAQTYFLIRELDAEQALYSGTVQLRTDTLRLVQRRFDEGDVSELELARAKTELASAQSESFGVSRRRANAEHALALLLGRAPADFALEPQPLERVTLDIPPGLPSALLERRPDIAAAERAMAAANARVGIAQAAWFPRLNLTGALGYESSELGNLFQWSTRSFVLGPLVGTALTLPIFDGGAREAGLERASAVYDEEVAAYRQTVLGAFREVEDNLAGLRILAEQTRTQDEAVSAAARAAQLSQIQYREGSVSQLDVIDADRSVLLQRRIASQLEGERARAAVGLIRALGGGWHSRAPADISDAGPDQPLHARNP
ncbi:efflux transporter outer membrane subunit [Methyloversatilis discipulorum]|uniref:efflux transporter outer membrane subunit n=1 Tax=Methyloversatilis discipulorum TaxID=1119528 RepID=UPI0026ED7E63|nr:efflux transporter outer membrane subunit [Methyloversatilis discipulorum]